MTRYKILLSAYACEPGRGSEGGVGWNLACELAKYHELWVITRENNQVPINQYIQKYPEQSRINFVYCDLPKWARWWKRGNRGIQLYYYLWQIAIFFKVRRLIKDVRFDYIHHITFGKYWVPSFLALLNVNFIWGPVGGGETMPSAFLPKDNLKALTFELVRMIARWLGEKDPFVRLTARKSKLAFATTKETAERLTKLGCRNVVVMPQVAFPKQFIEKLSKMNVSNNGTVKFISVGRPLYWKGFHLGLKAFAQARLEDAEYWLIANGEGKQTLLNLAINLKIFNKVKFLDRMPTLDTVYETIGKCDVLVHPALHEAFGTVVLEAMSIGKPVICLNIGGPGLQVNHDVGYPVEVNEMDTTIKHIALAMEQVASDVDERRKKGLLALSRVNELFSLEQHVMSMVSTIQRNLS